MTFPWYTDEEVDNLCEPLTQDAAKAKFLRKEYGLYVTRRRNGKVLLMRAHAEAVLGGAVAQGLASGELKREPKGPDEGALIDFLAARRAKKVGK